MTEDPPTPEQTPEEAMEKRVEERAEKLAERVEDAALAQTARVEKRAEDLAEKQAAQHIAERAEGRADIKSELADITAAIGLLIEHMDTNIPSDKVQGVLDAALDEERRDRKKLKWQVVSPVLIAIVVAAGSWLQSHENSEGIAASQKVARYVEHCLQGKTEGMTPEQITAECRAAGDDGTAAVLKVVFCVLQHEIGDRPPGLLRECYQRVQAGEFE